VTLIQYFAHMEYDLATMHPVQHDKVAIFLAMLYHYLTNPSLPLDPFEMMFIILQIDYSISF